MRRHSAMVAAALAFLLLAVVGLAVSAWMLSAANDRTVFEKELAEDNLEIAVDTIEQLLTQVASDADFHGQLHHPEILYRKSADAYERVLANSKDPMLVVKAAGARARLAEALNTAGQFEQALAETERGLGLLQIVPPAADLSGGELETRSRLLNLRRISHLHFQNHADAEWSLSEALHLTEQLVGSGQNRDKHLQSLAMDLCNLGVLRTEE